jgi:uncharacterized protein YbaP (TraB family)
MWVVERAGSRVYLFGEAVGLGDEGWLSEELRAAVACSRELWREADRQELAGGPLLMGYALGDVPLSARLDHEQLGRLHEFARGAGIDPSSLEGLRPWVVGQLLDQAMRSGAGYDDVHGVDTVITRLAAAAGVPLRHEFGDAAATFSWFDGLGPGLEVDYLIWTLERVTAGPEQVDRHAEAWRRGDLSVAEVEDRVMRRDHAALHERMLAERNRAWVPRIEAMLGEPGTAFVLVGGAHLVGEASVQACLARRGLDAVRLR